MRGQGILMLALLGGCQTTQDMQDPSPQACANCHMPEYKAAKGHVGARPTTCGICHAKNDWEPSRLEHPVPLLGAHANANCFWCHQGTPARFKGTPQACIACHRPDYDKSTFPGHDRFPTTCEQCHTQVSWTPTLPNPKLPPTVPTIVPVLDAGIPDAAPSFKPKPLPTPPDTISHPSRHVPTPHPTPTPTSTPTPTPTPSPPDTDSHPSGR